MKKIDVIRPGSLSAIIGPSGTLKRINKNRDYFLSRGYDIKIFTNDDLRNVSNGITPKNISKTNSNTLIKNILSKLKITLRKKAKHSSLLSSFYIKKSHHQVNKLLDFYFKQNRTPDIVVFHSYYECYLFLKANTNKKIKTICFYHSEGIPLKMEEIYYPKLKGSKLFNNILTMEKFVAENSNACTFISENGQVNFLEYYPAIRKEKTRVILNGIEDLTENEKSVNSNNIDDLSQFEYKFLCAGTINTRKGHKIIIDALQRIDKKILEKVHFTFLGDGPQRVELEENVRKNNLGLHVDFKGAIENSKVYSFLQKSNIYILMSYNEGLPISIIEAMRAGLPIISTKIAGIPELINENGVLLDPDVNQLVKVLNNIDTYDWKSMGNKSRDRFVNEFTFDRMKKEYCDMLDAL